MAGRMEFEAHFRRPAGRFIVLGSMFTGGLLVVAGLVATKPLMVALAIVFFGVSLHFYPMLQVHSAQIIASGEGLFLDGFGFLRWHLVEELELKQEFAGPKHSVMRCRLSPTAMMMDHFIPPDGALRSFQKRIWRFSQDNELVIDLSELDVSADKIFDTLNNYHKLATADDE